jgi:hypothetical protein
MEEPHAPTYSLARQGLRLRLPTLPSPSGGVEVQGPGPGRKDRSSDELKLSANLLESGEGLI